MRNNEAYVPVDGEFCTVFLLIQTPLLNDPVVPGDIGYTCPVLVERSLFPGKTS